MQFVTIGKVYPTFAIKKEQPSWLVNPTTNLNPWHVSNVTILLVYSVMVRSTFLSTCALAKQGMHSNGAVMIICYWSTVYILEDSIYLNSDYMISCRH